MVAMKVDAIVMFVVMVIVLEIVVKDAAPNFVIIVANPKRQAIVVVVAFVNCVKNFALIIIIAAKMVDAFEVGVLLKEDAAAFVKMNAVLEDVVFFVIAAVLREVFVMNLFVKKGFVLVQIVKIFYWM